MLSFIKTHNWDSEFDPEQDRDLVVAANKARTTDELARVVRMADQRLSARYRRNRGQHVRFSRRRPKRALHLS